MEENEPSSVFKLITKKKNRIILKRYKPIYSKGFTFRLSILKFYSNKES